MIRQMSFWIFALGGWVLAAHFFNMPVAPPCFSSPSVPDGVRTVEWNKGKYQIFSSGFESVTPRWGPITLAFSRGKKVCPQDIAVQPNGNTVSSYCYEGKVGSVYGRQEDLPAAAERVLRTGRKLAEQHWGPNIARRQNKD